MIELMIVVGIMVIVGGLAVRVMSRASRGERAPAFARSVLAMVHHARQQALVSGRATRITLYANGSSSTIMSERLEADGTTWTKLDGAEPSSHGVDVCDAQATRVLGTWPSSGLNCPTSATTSSPTYLMFGKGQCTGSSNYFNCVSGNTSSGSTIFLQTHDGGHKYRIPIWGLTGLPTLIDQ